MNSMALPLLRATYEPFVSALAQRIQVVLPPWIPPQGTLDDWQTSARDDRFPTIHQVLNKVMYPSERGIFRGYVTVKPCYRERHHWRRSCAIICATWRSAVS
jgi:hypothetical protein